MASPDDAGISLQFPRSSTASVTIGPFGEVKPIDPLGVAAYYERIYAEAGSDTSRVPWADGHACPHMISWLNRAACGLVRPGARALVVGCGLGDDVVELEHRGYDPIGFDISPTAIHWAAQRHREHAERFMVADLLAIPTRLKHRFDLVIEIYTLQSLHPTLRAAAARSLAELLSPRGVLLVICRRREDDEPLVVQDGPPWPLCPRDVGEIMEQAGLTPLGAPEAFMDHEQPPKPRYLATFAKP